MNACVAVHAQQIADLIRSHRNGVRLSHLAEEVQRRYGRCPVFHTNSRTGLSLDDLLVLMEARGGITIIRGVVYPV